jgi:uncharacterized protein (TIGR02284 family)
MTLATPIRRRAAQSSHTRADGPGGAASAAAADAATIDLLQHLADACADSAYGFASCADYANISQHRAWFRKRAQECEAAREQVQALALRLGAAPVHAAAGGTRLHRGWVAARGTLCGLRDASIVAECERGESLTGERYRQALQHRLPADVRTVLAHHLRASESSLQQIRSLRDALSATSQGAA